MKILEKTAQVQEDSDGKEGGSAAGVPEDGPGDPRHDTWGIRDPLVVAT